MKRWLLPTLLTLALLSCKPKGLEYLEFQNFQVVKMGFPNSTIGLEVTCYNPNKFGLLLNSLESDVYINSEYLGKARIDSFVRVPKKDTFLIPVKMDVKMGGTMNTLLSLISAGTDSSTLLIKFEGKAKLNKSGLSLTYPILYEGTKVIKW